jgi:hypothetical protein
MVNRVMAVKLLKMKKSRSKIPKALSAEAVRVARYAPSAVPPEIKGRKFDPPDSSVMERDVSNSVAWTAPIMKNFPFLFKGKAIRSWDDLLFFEFKEFCARHNVTVKRHMEKNKQGRILRRFISMWGIPFKDNDPRLANSISQARAQLRQRAFQATLEANKGAKLGKLRPEFYEPDHAVKGPMVLKQAQTLVTYNKETEKVKVSEEDTIVQEWRSWKRQGRTLFVRKNYIDRSDYQLDLWFFQDKVYFIELDTKRGVMGRTMNYRTITRALLELDRNNIHMVEYVPIEESS